MGREGDNLHILFLPLMAQGHMIPLVDMAKIFASRGVKVTIVTTPLNGQFISKTIQRVKDIGSQIDVRTIRFPAIEVGLPEGCESFESIPSDLTQDSNAIAEMGHKFFQATEMMQEPFEMVLQVLRPDCLIADMFFPWATDSAAKLGIPRLVFHGTCFFSLCILQYLRLFEPQMKLLSDSDPILLPNLPGEIKLTRKLIPQYEDGSVVAKAIKDAGEAELKSYGVVVNSFYELEPSYADHYRNGLGKKAWHIGPVSMYNKDLEDKSTRGKEASIDNHECLKWLDSKKPNSVVYVCFGSTVNFQASQLKEIALGLEASGQEFIWGVRKGGKDPSDWIPEGFEERMEGKGLIVRGWVPQLVILNHEAVGGFVTHCGWNSILECVAAGLPMVTWPVLAEQFFNEIFVTQVSKIGVSVGAAAKKGNDIGSEAIKDAVIQIMKGEIAEEMRWKARELGQMANRAIEEGGSSYSDLTALIEEIRLHKKCWRTDEEKVPN